MTVANRSELLLLKMGDGASPVEVFTTLAGLRTTRFMVNRQPVAVQNVIGQGWREILPQSGTASVRVQGVGTFVNGEAEKRLRAKAVSGEMVRYELCFGNGDVIRAGFVVGSYESGGRTGELEGFSVTLESAGAVEFVEG